MKIKLILILTFLHGICLSQNNQAIPFIEKVQLQLNTKTIVSGDKLLYNAFCLDDKNQLGTLSKIVYVKLYTNQGQELASNKHVLENGSNSGYFFIPTTYKTGLYKIIAYTKWIANNTQLTFCEEEIIIINPYQKNEKSVFKLEDSLNKSIQLQPKLQYDKRQQINWISKNNKKNGNFTISIRKTNDITTTATLNRSESTITSSSDTNFKVILPELKGELISGKIISEDANLSVAKIEVVLTDKKNINYFYTTTTNENGMFYFVLPNGLTSSEIFIEPLTKRKEYTIILEEAPELRFQKSDPKESIVLKDNYEQEIKKIAIAAQIENAYFEVKKDSTSSYSLKATLNNQYLKNYDLLNITKFSSLKEFIIEVINSAYYTDKNDDFKIKFRDNDISLDIKEEPLVIVDGTLITNQNDLLTIDFRKIIQISIYNKPYYLGNTLYGGIFIVKTDEENFTDTSNKMQKIRVPYQTPFPKFSLFNPDYSSSKLAKIPDYRMQLLWQNNITSLEKPITFFTSDIEGNYEIHLTGYTNDGQFIEEKEIFSVQ